LIKTNPTQAARNSSMTSGIRKKLVEQLRERGIKDERVLRAIEKIPREEFLDEHFLHQAYEDNALPIGEGQTISQPYTVAFMTEALELKAGEKVLEIGTGSGYQAAVLAELGVRVYTIERHMALAELAAKRLEKLKYRVVSRTGDGTRGWADYAPFDGIIVTAGAPDVPKSLTKQLNPSGGRLLIPIGDRATQTMFRITRNGDELKGEELSSFKFVPLIGKEGWEGK
jgi:protein-L-isoaspartate(D-aspartate) O-methyltransferase